MMTIFRAHYYNLKWAGPDDGDFFETITIISSGPGQMMDSEDFIFFLLDYTVSNVHCLDLRMFNKIEFSCELLLFF